MARMGGCSVILVVMSTILKTLLVTFPSGVVRCATLFVNNTFITYNICTVLDCVVGGGCTFALALNVVSTITNIIIYYTCERVVAIVVFLLNLCLLINKLFGLISTF